MYNIVTTFGGSNQSFIIAIRSRRIVRRALAGAQHACAGLPPAAGMCRRKHSYHLHFIGESSILSGARGQRRGRARHTGRLCFGFRATAAFCRATRVRAFIAFRASLPSCTACTKAYRRALCARVSAHRLHKRQTPHITLARKRAAPEEVPPALSNIAGDAAEARHFTATSWCCMKARTWGGRSNIPAAQSEILTNPLTGGNQNFSHTRFESLSYRNKNVRNWRLIIRHFAATVGAK